TIFLKKEDIDMEMLKQVKKIIQHPSISNARIMPDCHLGVGCCIGFTSHLIDKVVPNLIGGDIGCGILAYPVPNLLNKKSSTKRVEKVIKSIIPMGNGHDKVHSIPIINEEQYDDFFEQARVEAIKFSDMYKEKLNTDITPNIPNYSREWF